MSKDRQSETKKVGINIDSVSDSLPQESDKEIEKKEEVPSEKAPLTDNEEIEKKEEVPTEKAMITDNEEIEKKEEVPSEKAPLTDNEEVEKKEEVPSEKAPLTGNEEIEKKEEVPSEKAPLTGNEEIEKKEEEASENEMDSSQEASHKQRAEFLKLKPEKPKFSLKNGMVGKEYCERIVLDNYRTIDKCTIEGLDDERRPSLNEIGLEFDEKNLTIKGIPKKDGHYDIVIRYRTKEGEEDKKVFTLFINPDPRSLWKNLEPPPEVGDRKDHESYQHLKAGNLVIIGASKRGRSHAHEGKFRDDDFYIKYLEESGWSIIAVADGAGSAPLSRVGSELACKTAVRAIEEDLIKLDQSGYTIQSGEKEPKETDLHELERNLEVFKRTPKDDKTFKYVMYFLYHLFGNAASESRRIIKEESIRREIIVPSRRPEDYFATTLLLAIHRKFKVGHFFAGFQIGDGGIAVYKEGREAKLLGIPDTGEFGGQTRFITTPNILSNSNELIKRIKFELIDDFTALFVMSDGITDPKFETDNNLEELQYWDKFWQELIDTEGADILSNTSDKEKPQLLKWLDFWSPGNHDDRTIVILKAGERKNG